MADPAIVIAVIAEAVQAANILGRKKFQGLNSNAIASLFSEFSVVRLCENLPKYWVKKANL